MSVLQNQVTVLQLSWNIWVLRTRRKQNFHPQRIPTPSPGLTASQEDITFFLPFQGSLPKRIQPPSSLFLQGSLRKRIQSPSSVSRANFPRGYGLLPSSPGLISQEDIAPLLFWDSLLRRIQPFLSLSRANFPRGYSPLPFWDSLLWRKQPPPSLSRAHFPRGYSLLPPSLSSDHFPRGYSLLPLSPGLTFQEDIAPLLFWDSLLKRIQPPLPSGLPPLTIQPHSPSRASNMKIAGNQESYTLNVLPIIRCTTYVYNKQELNGCQGKVIV